VVAKNQRTFGRRYSEYYNWRHRWGSENVSKNTGYTGSVVYHRGFVLRETPPAIFNTNNASFVTPPEELDEFAGMLAGGQIMGL
jgi:hypothetical protein